MEAEKTHSLASGSWRPRKAGSVTQWVWKLKNKETDALSLSPKFWKSRGWWFKLSYSVVSDSLWPHGLSPARLLYPWNFPGKNTGVGCHSLLHGIYRAQGLNLGFLHCRRILYHLSHQGSPLVYTLVFFCVMPFKIAVISNKHFIMFKMYHCLNAPSPPSS